MSPRHDKNEQIKKRNERYYNSKVEHEICLRFLYNLCLFSAQCNILIIMQLIWSIDLEYDCVKKSCMYDDSMIVATKSLLHI
mmetsp:Transcript_11637/g.20230  ORF Transcript_11637/g.20230 Transcript_11637/m.20230 type:complete len:82 (+) Transcript_11637:877-1122(+)